MEEKEIWKDIEGFEGMYQISNRGNVKSLNYNKTGKERILKPNKVSHGYLQVQLHQDGKAKNYYVHRLVAAAFCDNPHGFKEVNHIDEDKTNNCADNLEFCSKSYNNNYGTRNKRIAEKRSKPVIAIDKRTGLILEFLSALEAEKETGINNGNIIKCCKGKLNSCGGFYWMYKNNNDTTEE